MGRGTGEEAAGTVALRTSYQLKDEEIETIEKFNTLFDKGERVFADGRKEKDGEFWHNVAAVQQKPYFHVSAVEENDFKQLKDYLKEPGVIFVEKGPLLKDDRMRNVLENLSQGKSNFSDLEGDSYEKDPEAVVVVEASKKVPSWLNNKGNFFASKEEKIVFDLTTEQLGILADQGKITLSQGTAVYHVTKKDLSGSLKDLSEGKELKAKDIFLRYA